MSTGMKNLLALQAAIVGITEGPSATLAAKVDLSNKLNDGQDQVWFSRKWLFGYTTEDLPVYRDITYARTSSTTCSFTNNSRQVTFSAAIREFTEPWVWEGQYIELGGRDYRILKIVSTTELRLTEVFRGTTTAADTAWKVKFKDLVLPHNCQELVSATQRGSDLSGVARRGPLEFLRNAVEEICNFDPDQSGSDAQYILPAPPIVVPPGEQVSSTVGAAYGVSYDIPDNYYVEVCWCFELFGCRGPLSQPLLYKTGTAEVGGHQLTFTAVSHDLKSMAAATYSASVDTEVNENEGMRKVWFYNQNISTSTGTRKGLPVWREIGVNTTATPTQYDHQPYRTNDEAATLVLARLSQVTPGRPRYTGQPEWQVMRPWPRIDTSDADYGYDAGPPVAAPISHRRIEARYYRRPAPLLADTDTPEFPRELHMLVAYEACFNAFSQKNNMQQAMVYANLSETLINRHGVRHLARDATSEQIGQRGRRSRGGRRGRRTFYGTVDHTP